QQIVLGLGAVLFLLPVLWAFIGSIKPREELMLKPWALPLHPVWYNYRAAIEGQVLRYLLNSGLITVVAVAAMLIIAVPAAYSFARLPLRGRGLLMALAVSGLLLPAHAALIPVYEFSQRLHLADLPALVGPYVAFGLPLTILLLQAYFAGLPQELIDAALMDGASHWRIAWTILVPVARPALVTVAIFQAAWVWNELPFALVLIKSPQWQTLPRGLLSFQGQYTSEWGAVLAGVVLAIIPVLALYLAFQRHVIRGLTAGAVR
ncbi:MAG: carbohydrate ABC transporter permease, partial [Armatimonadetes bacterium]|nr:carbohydrate ABC transporter permease [Armatimonadota bacterium]